MANSLKHNGNSPDIEIPINGKAVSVKELAELWRVRQDVIRKYINDGMPTYKGGGKGVGHVLATEDCYRWRETRAVNEAVSRLADKLKLKPSASEDTDRLKQIKIETAEIALAERRGDLFHMVDWIPLIEETALATRQRFQNVPMDFQTEFSDTPRIGQMVRWLNGAINKAMRSLSDGLLNVPQQAEDQK